MSEGRFTGEYEIIPPAKKAESKDPGQPTLTMSGPDPRPDSNYDPDELAAGTQEEMEHTNDPEVAKAIAKTQLDSNPKYYSQMKTAGLL